MKGDFQRLEGFPDDWCFILNQHGEGVCTDFPLKAKAIHTWTTSKYIVKNRKLVKAPRVPILKVVIFFAKKHVIHTFYNIDNNYKKL